MDGLSDNTPGHKDPRTWSPIRANLLQTNVVMGYHHSLLSDDQELEDNYIFKECLLLILLSVMLESSCALESVCVCVWTRPNSNKICEVFKVGKSNTNMLTLKQ